MESCTGVTKTEFFEAPLTGCLKSPSMDFFNHETGKYDFPVSSFPMAYSR